MVDAFQRSVLFLDLLRQRGNEEIEITSRPMATVLRFGHEILMDGRSLPRPINYALSRIVPPPGVVIDRRKRPVVVVDPRAGQGRRHRRLQGRKRDRRCPECGPSGLLHRLRGDAGARTAIPGRRRGTGEVLRTRRGTPSRRTASVRHRQLPGRLSDADGGDAATGSVRSLPGGRLADVGTGRACTARTRCATLADCSAEAGSPR